MEITPERERLIHEKFDTNHFPRMLGIEIDSIEHGRAVLSVEVRKELKQLQGVMHGGAIASLIDTAVAFAIIGASQPEDRFTTVEMKINYLSSIREGRVRADARLLRDGRRIIVAECDVFDDKGRMAAKGLLTYIRLNEKGTNERSDAGQA
jgi:acyl-CoA thioesterase